MLACPFDALERTGDGVIKRHNMRCVSCKSCALACPFGTIYKELLPFYSMDYGAAVGFVRASLARESSEPGPVDNGREQGALLQGGCRAVQLGEVDEGDPGIHIVDEHLAARTRRWVRKEVAA